MVAGSGDLHAAFTVVLGTLITQGFTMRPWSSALRLEAVCAQRVELAEWRRGGRIDDDA